MLIDSNVLIYALNKTSPKQSAAQAFLNSQKKLIFAQQNIFETLRILTHTKFPQPFSVNEALSAVKTICQHARIISPTFETEAIAFALIKKYQITGAETFDAYLVATALTNDITELASDNTKHLKKYAEISVINPFL